MKKSFSAKNLTLVALMTAILCIVSPFALPLGFTPVPLTLSTLAIYLNVFILGAKKGSFSCLLYLLLGAVGLPVFSGFSGGIGKLLGPTGGYLIGYLFLALITGAFLSKSLRWYNCLSGMLCGTAACYLFGTLWLAYQMKLSFLSALALGVLPYIPTDIIKMLCALAIGIPIRKALIKANLFVIYRERNRT